MWWDISREQMSALITDTYLLFVPTVFVKSRSFAIALFLIPIRLVELCPNHIFHYLLEYFRCETA